MFVVDSLCNEHKDLKSKYYVNCYIYFKLKLLHVDKSKIMSCIKFIHRSLNEV